MSFRLRLTVTIALLIAVTFGIGGTVLITASFNTSLEKETEAALDSFETVQNTLYLLNAFAEQTDYASLSDALSQMEQRGSLWQALSLSMDGETLYLSGSEESLRCAVPSPEQGTCAYAPVSDRRGQGLVVLGQITAGDSVLELRARFDLSAVYTARDTQTELYTTIYLIVVGVGILVSVTLSFALTRRLRRLTGAVRQIAAGDLATRCQLRSRDEFGQLSRDFDAMADHLQQTVSRLETDMQRQESFMGAFAHELKTPMTSIIGYADLLRQGGLDDNTRMMAADYIFSEGQRLEKLSLKLLDLLLLKQDAPEMKEVSLPQFLQEIEKALSPTLREKGIRFVVRSDRGRAVLEPDLAKSLLYNLVDNAAKAMDGGGLIGLKGSILPEGCQFQVVDNGRGMEQSELTRITEAFYRVDKSRSRKQGGAGLGLALCQKIVELHHGSIRFLSAPGTGTRVTVTLCGKAGEDHG